MSTVLIVDDERDIVEALRELLEEEGFRAVTAANGREAMARLEQERPSIILLDLMMPLMNGWEVLAELSKDGGLKIPVIVMSAGGGQKAAEQYGTAFLKKPFDLDQLLTLIETKVKRGS